MPEKTLLEDYAVILMFLVFGAAFAVLNIGVISKLLRKDTPGHVKGLSYECGEPTFGSSFIRFDIRFYVVALVFLIFDVEVVFLVPWAVALKGLRADGMGLLAFAEAAVFVAILTAGLVYVWKKGDIEWIPRGMAQAQDAQARREAGGTAAEVSAASTRADAPSGGGA